MSKERKYFNEGKYRNGTNNASGAIYYNKYRMKERNSGKLR